MRLNSCVSYGMTCVCSPATQNKQKCVVAIIVLDRLHNFLAFRWNLSTHLECCEHNFVLNYRWIAIWVTLYVYIKLKQITEFFFQKQLSVAFLEYEIEQSNYKYVLEFAKGKFMCYPNILKIILHFQSLKSTTHTIAMEN